jgi:DNA mismatch repair protein MutL
LAVRLLDEATINKIAAGEVIERPASVIKELIENSLDAGARRVEVRIERDCLAVADDGCGMAPPDLKLAVLRHATSKIAAVEDLSRLATYGFRGEALPSIAAVSELTIRSRRAEQAAGTSIVVRGGEVVETSSLPMAAGTQVEVRRLFYNTPVRAKFLRSDRTEQGRLLHAVERLAMARPDVAFHCTIDGRMALATPGTGSHLETLLAIAGIDTARAVRQAALCDGDRSVVALVGAPSTGAADRRRQAVWVNGRPVLVRGPLEAAQAAYPLGVVAGKRYPMIYLFYSLPAAEVDANVHPAKAEVRLAAGSDVVGLAVRAVRHALGTAGGQGDAATAAAEARRDSGPGAEPTAGRQLAWGEALARQPAAMWPAVAGEAPAGHASPAGYPLPASPPSPALGLSPALIAELRLLGQSGRRWLVGDGPDGVYFVDQHAAHERVLYEAMAAAERRATAADAGGGGSQPLALPEAVELDVSSYPAWLEVKDVLAAAGLATEAFGGRSVLVRAVPANIVGPGFSAAGFLRDVLLALEQDSARQSALAPQLRARRALASCAAAVKASQPLAAAEAQALLADLSRCGEPWRCPHGRPTIVRVGHDELGRRFGRG